MREKDYRNFGGMVIAIALGVMQPAASRAVEFDEGLTVLETIITANEDGAAILSREPLEQYLQPTRRIVDESGNEILTYSKRVGGVPVYGETVALVYRSGESLPSLPRGEAVLRSQVLELSRMDAGRISARITLERAQQIATRHTREIGEFIGEGVPEEWLQDPRTVLFRPQDEDLRLAYHLTGPARSLGQPTTREYFIDAEDGRILCTFARIYDFKESRGEAGTRGKGYGLRSGEIKEFPVLQAGSQYRLEDTGRDLKISSVELGTPSEDGDNFWERVGQDRAGNQRAEVELYLNFIRIVDFYKQRWGFLWNGTVKAVAHVNDPRTGQGNFDNAYFSPWQNAFFFGDGSATDFGFDYLGKALDVAGHEFGHGFIDKEGPLTYSGEAGALNEHIADLFGVCVDDGDWMIGNDITVGASAGKGLRNLRDPANGRGDQITPGMKYDRWRSINSGRPFGERAYPDHVTKKIVCRADQDNGGVHVNSSIFNRFSYLASTGDGLGSEGLGRQLLADVYVKAMKSDLYSQNASFQEFRDAIVAAADLQLANDPKASVYKRTIRLAFNAIGL